MRDFVPLLPVPLITSRTQYFPSEENNPYDLSIKKSNGNGFHVLKKIYISPFNTNEIKRYLNKKYGIFKFWNIPRRMNAQKIIINSPNLVVRPMLLNYVDYIISTNKSIDSIHNIYKIMINGWIKRESKRRKIKKSEQEKFEKDLLNYSRLVALEINKRKDTEKELSLEKEIVIKIAEYNKINLDFYEITGESLLTRDVCNRWKFAHKSIYEYFIANELLENKGLRKSINLDNMDFTKTIIIDYLRKKLFKKINDMYICTHLYGYIGIPGGTAYVDEQEKFLNNLYKTLYLSTIIQNIKSGNLNVINIFEENKENLKDFKKIVEQFNLHTFNNEKSFYLEIKTVLNEDFNEKKLNTCEQNLKLFQKHANIEVNM